MEHIFDPRYLKRRKDVPTSLEPNPVQLKREHLWISAEVAEKVFGSERHAYVVYYPQRQQLLLAPMSDEAFKSLHECSLFMLKDKSIHGDKALAIRELIIDHNLDAQDRQLSYKLAPGAKLLAVTIE